MNAQDITMLVRDFAFPWSTPEETNKRWQKYYTQQQEGVRTVAVLATADELLGYGSLLLQSEYPHFANVAENIPEICDVWIHEKHRRSGLGKKLLTWLELLAKKQGYNQIGIGVGLYADYGPAQQLYFQLGYAPDGHGITYKCQPTTAGKTYPLDDDLILWLTKTI
ncbi:MAG: GNAT family N-acetyltransferase [Verrucomicrobia bacterium]|nr:GNAT family N-acetyltransferase [Verrucomicrobiota bacterium]